MAHTHTCMCRYIQPPPTAGLVRRAAQAPHEVTLTRGRAHVTKGHTVWLVRLKEVTTREAALALRNHRCAAPPAATAASVCARTHRCRPFPAQNACDAPPVTPLCVASRPLHFLCFAAHTL